MRRVLAFLPLFLFFACKSQPKTELEVADFAKAIARPNIQILDVRTPDEFNAGHIDNALLADWRNQTEFNRRIQFVDKDKPVYIYCLSGGRSAAAAQWMRTNGFGNVVELKGGISAWRAASQPVAATVTLPQMTLREFTAQIPPDTVCLVDIGAKWCPPCVKLAPVLDQLEKEMAGKLKIIRIDAAVQTEIQQQLGIVALPGLLVYKKGQQTWKHEGIATKEEILQQLR